ncbi:MAG: glycyl-radical enzyme activating protein [Bacillota bacterium]
MFLNSGAGTRGTIFNIQRYSIHDGPGIRTVVFLKGCPLRCLCCSNPESQLPTPEVMFYEDKCARCLRCVSVCPNTAWHLRNGVLTLDRSRCTGCGKCASVCPNAALKVIGASMAPGDVVQVVEQDRAFYDESGGGVTLSGGEPAFQSRFAAEILKRCRDRYIHTAVETTGFAPWEDLKRIAEPADLVLYDFKHPYPEEHRRFTGASNELILENAKSLSRLGKEMIIRIPLVPDVNDDPRVLKDLCNSIQEIGSIVEVDILPYHEYGRPKYQRLGREYPLNHRRPVDSDSEAVAKAVEAFREGGFKVQVGG